MRGNIVLGIKPNALLEFFLHVAESLVQPLLFMLHCVHMSLDAINFLLIYKSWSLRCYNQFFFAYLCGLQSGITMLLCQ